MKYNWELNAPETLLIYLLSSSLNIFISPKYRENSKHLRTLVCFLLIFSQFIPISLFNELGSLDLLLKITFDTYLFLNLLFNVSTIPSITGSDLCDKPP